MTRGRWAGVLFAAVLGACVAEAVPRFERLTPRAPDVVYARTLVILSRLGYTITGGALAARQVIAQRQVVHGDVSGAPTVWSMIRVDIRPDSSGQTRCVVHWSMLEARYGSTSAIVLDSIPTGEFRGDVDSVVAGLGGP